MDQSTTQQIAMALWAQEREIKEMKQQLETDILVFDEGIKAKLVTALAGDGKGKRVRAFKALVVEIAKDRWPGTNRLSEASDKTLEESLLRFKSWHKTPVNGKPWKFTLALGISAPTLVREAVGDLAAHGGTAGRVLFRRPLPTVGPTVQRLCDSVLPEGKGPTAKGKGKGKGKHKGGYKDGGKGKHGGKAADGGKGHQDAWAHAAFGPAPPAGGTGQSASDEAARALLRNRPGTGPLLRSVAELHAMAEAAVAPPWEGEFPAAPGAPPQAGGGAPGGAAVASETAPSPGGASSGGAWANYTGPDLDSTQTTLGSQEVKDEDGAPTGKEPKRPADAEAAGAERKKTKSPTPERNSGASPAR